MQTTRLFGNLALDKQVGYRASECSGLDYLVDLLGMCS